MKFQAPRNEHGQLAEINIIPLVDVILVLLIIFMVTAPMLQEGIEIDLPEVSASSVESTDKDVVLTIDEDGQVFINENEKEKFSILSIEDKLMLMYKDRPQKVLYLKADQSVKYGYVVEIMAACRRAGVEKIGMITHTPDDEKAATKDKHAKK